MLQEETDMAVGSIGDTSITNSILVLGLMWEHMMVRYVFMASNL